MAIHNFLKVCSVLPAMAIMPAMAEYGPDYRVSGDELNQKWLVENNSVGVDESFADVTLLYYRGTGGQPVNATILADSVFRGNTAQVGGVLATSGNTAERATLTIEKGTEFTGNTALYDGGAIGNYGTLIADGVSFIGNTAQIMHAQDGRPIGGGAIALGAASATMITNSMFQDNISKLNGGAIGTRMPLNVDGTKTNNSAATVDITAIFQDNHADQHGGAIYNTFYNDVKYDGLFYSNSAGADGGAIYNDGTTADITGNKGGVITVSGGFGGAGAGNSAGSDGGAIYNNEGQMTVVDATFNSNTAAEYGGAIMNRGEMTVSGSEFVNNVAGLIGGAISTSTREGVMLTVKADENGNKTVFQNNHSKGDGGAIGSYKGLDISGAEFIGNTAQLVQNANGEWVNAAPADDTAMGGGAIALGAVSQSKIASITSTTFKNNVSGTNGGAIATRLAKDANNSAAKLTVDATFEGNHANQHGGAVYNTFYADVNYSGAFAQNSAGKNGGAIYNDGAVDKAGNAGGVMSITDAVFSKNTAAAQGGAIYNTGTMTITGTDADTIDFVGNSAVAGGAIFASTGSDLTIKYADFAENTASHGGAIYTGNKNNNLTVENSVFQENESLTIGAVGVFSSASFKDVQFIKNVATDSSKFRGHAGALFLGAASTTSIDGVISNVVFDGNESASNAGALGTRYFQDGNNVAAKLDISKATFKNNVASKNGGAFDNFFYSSNNNADAVYITDSVFDTNTAVLGGAVYNHGSVSAQLPGTSDDNKQSGAIVFNNVNFTNNVARTSGAAIYNELGANVTFTGENTFTKNMIMRSYANDRYGAAVSQANDIHNLGAINIASGQTTIGGGVTGNGKFDIASGAELILAANDADTIVNLDNAVTNAGTITVSTGVATIAGGMGIGGAGTLTVAEGATLNVGTATIDQTALNLNGTINVDVLKNGRGTDGVKYRTRESVTPDIASAADKNLPFGKLRFDTITFGNDGLLNLNIGSAGTYEMFGNALIAESDASKVKFGETYNVSYAYKKNSDGSDATTDGGDKIGLLVVETKAVDQIATDANITTDTAQVVSYLANSDSSDLVALSLRTQQELNAGNTEYVERELSKMNPDNKPITQSVATSAQNEILTLVASRMAGGATVGRSGGDFGNAEYGMWAHGLFNKSKMNDQFHGYTRGVAIGVDALIDNVYTLGIGAAFNNTDVHANNARDTNIDSNSVFVYGQYKPDNWYINGAATYTRSEYDETVNPMGTIFHNKYDVNAYGASIMTGYDFASGFTPEMGARYLHIAADSYTDGSGRRVAGDDTNYMTGVAGIKYAFALDSTSQWNWRPELRAAATYDFVSDDAYATINNPGAAAYIIDSGRLNRVGGEFGLGMNMNYRGLDILVKYDVTLRQDYTSQTGTIKFRLDF